MPAAPKLQSRPAGAYFGMLLSIGLWALTLGITTATAMAGDLLRGGYTTSKGGSSSTPGSFTPPSELEARANMVDQLARATKAIEAVGQLQSSARAIAIAAAKNNAGINPNNTSLQLPNVPNGLGVGGLEPVAGATSNSSVWSGATLPTQTTSAGQTVVTVDQDKEDAVLTWTSFNVGSATTLDFNQSKTGASTEDSIVFNVIKNSTGVPSQILGSIKAAGQVYVIDQNGIIFGATSEINVHTLVASSLPINNYLIGVGLVNNPDDQYLFSQLAIPALASNPTAPAFPTPAAPDTPDGKDGSVIVEAGAVLESPADADNVGGRIALVGPNVDNAGTILTPDGQTILAAGLQVGFLPHPSSDPSLRGLDVFIGQGGGTATNTGNILSPEGDVTIMGAAVQQNGVIQSTTSVSLNGEINLDADWGTSVVQVNNVNELQTTEAGTVTFGPSSVTDILPEVNSDATITSAEPPPNQSLALTSQVNIQGENIHMEGNASLLAPNATVNMQAGAWDSVGSGQYAFAYTKGQIYLDSGATIDVAGSEDVAASVAQNIVAVQLLGPELADSPLQRNGLLRDQTIYVDIRDQGVYDGTPWIGTPLADAYGYAGLVEYTVGELTTNGGTVSMRAGGSVVMQKGAEVNVSSGWINYTGGVVTTSELISGGNIYPISEATPDLVYSGFLPQFNFDAPKWGVSETYDDPLITGSHYENGYVYGGNGGSITISAPATALEGTLLGLTVNGPRQTGPASVQATPSSLTVAFEGQNPSVTSPLFPVYSPTPPDVVFSTQDDLPAAGAFSLDASGDPAALSTALSSKVVLSPDLFTTNGFGNLTVRDGDGTVTVPAGVELDAGDGGSVTMTAANMNIDGSIVAPGGSINLTVYDYSPYEFTVLNSETDPATPAPNSARGNFVLGSGASLDVAGLVIDDRDGAPDAGTLPEETAGGSVSIDSYNADIEAGSSINVSGGVEETAAGKPAYGAGGSISILAGSDPEIATLLGGRLELEGQLSGYSGSRGGSLTVQSQQIQIGGQAGNGTLLLTPQFFDDGGFGSFTLESLHDLTIAPGTMLDPIAESLLALPYAPGGQGLQTETALLPVNSRTPVSLTLDAEGVADKFAGDPDFGDFVFVGNIVMGAGADISTDPLGSVTLAGDTVSVLGSIDAPGGKITISGQNSSTALGSTNVGTAPVASVYLSPETTLSTAGTTIYTPNNHGYITGSVIPGGSISISGNIVAEAGAVLNVSGASNTLDESPGYTNVSEGLDGVSVSSGLEAVMNGSFEGALLVPTLVESNAGSITLKGQEELFTDATLLGAAGGSEALGGTLTVSSGVFNPNSLTLSPAQVELVVTEAGPTIAGAAPAPGDSVIDHPVTGANTQVTGLQDDGGHIAVSSFGGGGFASINLIASNGAVDFSGPVSISATRSISVGNGGSTSGGGFITGNGAITLAAPFVDLGTGFLPPTPIEQVTAFNPTNAVAPTWGTGSLTVRAQLIDVGNLSLQGIGSLNLIADGGNIQGDGTLDVAGDIQLTAGQIYPPTETTFEIVAYNYTNAKDDAENGTVTIKGSGTQTLPLSAGGTLDIYAADIVQDGVLRAPFGTINLGWDGSGTAPQDPITGAGYISGDSVPITQTVTLGAGSTTSVSAVDPLTGKGITIPYGLILNGVSWIDPSGVDITSVGAPQKAINISGENVTEKHGATIDIRGGGDLFAYQFVSGVDGNVDLLGSPATSWTAKVEYFAGQTVSYNGATYAATATSTGIAPTPGTYWQLIPQAYAIIPGYSVNYAPYAAFNPDQPTGSTELANLGGDGGYTNSSLIPGDTIYLAGGGGLAAGTYTLLPARYATMPGAYLVSPLGGTPGESGLQPSGASVEQGYTIGTGQARVSNYEVESPSVVAQQAQYDTFSGTSFLGANSTARTPADSGQLILQATEGMQLEGAVLSKPVDAGAQGGLVEIYSSPSETITIAAPGQASGGSANNLVLDSGQLSAIDAQTLLIGGYATTGPTGTTVTVSTDDLTVDSGASLSAGDVILVANGDLTVDNGASIFAKGTSDTLALSLTGNGTALRISNDLSAGLVRSGITSAGTPGSLTVGAGASSGSVTLKGASVILDSSQDSSLNPTASLDAKAVTIDSGSISIVEPGFTGGTGLVLSGNALQQIQHNATALTLLSYSSIDIYGTGVIGTAGVGSITLSAAEIRGFDQSGGTATLAGKTITLTGNANGTAPAPGGTADGTLAFNANVIQLGSATLAINQFSNVQLNATDWVIGQGTGGLTTPGTLTLTTPMVTESAGAQQTISAGGAVSIVGSTPKATITSGLAASLSITGASIEDNGTIDLPSGVITLVATSGNLNIGDSATSVLNVAGTVKDIFDQPEYTSGGTVNLTADTGSVTLGSLGTINVSAPSGGKDAGTLNVSDPEGLFNPTGTLLASSGAGGNAGSFSLNESTLPALSALAPILNTAGFTQSLQIEVETGDLLVDGVTTADHVDLSTDQGSISVTGDIDAQGETGGTITLNAAQSVTLENGSTLNASGATFNDAGKGGAVTLSAGADIDGQASSTATVDVATGSTIELGVADSTANSENLGDFTGTLLIRAPQTAAGTDVDVAPIDGTVTGASAIVVEGYRIYNAATNANLTGGQISSALETEIYNDGVNFLGANGQTTAAYTAMLDRLEGTSGLTINIETGAEIINLSGNLTLGTSTSTSSADWNLANDRFGPDGTAGQLTLRASGNLVLYNSLSDGFQGTTNTAALLAQNTNLPANIQSWSYTLTAGANLNSADPTQVIAGNGSLELGKNDPTPYSTNGGSNVSTASVLTNYYQVIRTGAGNIQISTGANVELLNEFATIYTAGTQLTAAETDMGGAFQAPSVTLSAANLGASFLGSLPESAIYPAQYSDAGGDVTIAADDNIEHLTERSGQLVEDSSLEMPNNWLYRRGYYSGGESGASKYGDNASTTWWVDFSNFFEGVGALGGGNVALTAGENVSNVDAVAPTNARMPSGTPSTAALVELGGGDVTVTAGNDINAGVYYVERGEGTLTAGNMIITNSTRTGTVNNLLAPGTVEDSTDLDANSSAWLPTTLFLGQGDFTVTAGNDLLLGPVANVFLMPQGISNTYWYKTYFSTYATTDAVDVTSLAGSVTLGEGTTNSNSTVPFLESWMENVDLFTFNSNTVSWYEPWLRLAESDASEFGTALSIMPSTLDANALSGNVNINGNLTLSPSPDGTLDLLAAGSINATQPTGLGTPETGVTAELWSDSTIDISDASPGAIWGVDDPFAYQTIAGISLHANPSAAKTPETLLLTLDDLFAESGATNANLQTKEDLHGATSTASGNEPLHSGDTTPVDIYAENGSISGLTLYSPTETRVIAGTDITDIALYIQNVSASQISVVSAGRNIIAYDPNSVLRTEAQETGNFIVATPDEGDIQISGPGTLEVLAGDDLDLGVGPNGDEPGLGVGITSIGNQRNPYLPSTGADVVAAGGAGPLTDLSDSGLDFSAFTNAFVTGPQGAAYLAELSSIETDLPSFSTAAEFNALPADERDLLALDVFFLVLRDAGRDHNLVGSPGYGTYAAGYDAIADLFPNPGNGSISLTSREIATENGGNVSILNPGGALTVGVDIQGNQPLDQGIFTEDGGNISIFTKGSIIVGTSRIFTLRGGNEILWSTDGNIAAGESSKTVQEAPPTQVIVDPTSANVETDLGGLATGGGIGVLASVQGVPAGNVDLIAPVGTVDAGDAGIRVTGNLNIAAAQVLNIGNIQVGGASTGVPVTTVAAPNVGALTAASSAAGAGDAAANTQINTTGQSTEDDSAPSIVTVQVIGYGGDDED